MFWEVRAERHPVDNVDQSAGPVRRQRGEPPGKRRADHGGVQMQVGVRSASPSWVALGCSIAPRPDGSWRLITGCGSLERSLSNDHCSAWGAPSVHTRRGSARRRDICWSHVRSPLLLWLHRLSYSGTHPAGHGGVHADPLDASRHNHQLPTPMGGRLVLELCELRMTDYGGDLLCWAKVATTSILPHSLRQWGL